MKLKSFKEYRLLSESVNTLKISIPKPIYGIHKVFKKGGYKLYIVGGAVRDAVLGIKPKDFDLATDAKPDEIQNLLNKAGINNFPKGEQFGVISAVIDGEEYEIATFREDIGKGRRPDAVSFTSIDKDVLRRDLTINALFYDIDREEIVDLVGGLKDLADKMIRTVGDPLARFGEDPLRKMRALRFAARLGAELSPEVAAALSRDEFDEYKKGESLGDVSKERIRNEFLSSIQKAKVPSQYLQWLCDYKYWIFIFPTPTGYGLRDDSFINKIFIDSNDPMVQIATILKNIDRVKNPQYGLTLKKSYGYSIDDVRQIETLLSFLSFDAINISNIKKDIEISGLKERTAIEFAENNAIDVKLIKAIYKFKTSVKGNDPRLQGLSGKSLGDKMKELEAEAFKITYDI
jgi:tRNA nucleotidyltransferase/poly(A) polymerase